MTSLHRLTSGTMRRALRPSPSTACLSARRANPTPVSRFIGVPMGAGLATLSHAMRIGTVHCREPARMAPEGPSSGGRPMKGGDDIDPFSERIASMITTAMMQLGSAGLLGFCAGIALKRATTEAAYTVGVAFVFLQVLAYKGYIDIQWKRIRADVLYLVDTDGDGEVTRKDVLKYVKGLMNVLVFKLPSTSGFTVGLVYGFRWS